MTYKTNSFPQSIALFLLLIALVLPLVVSARDPGYKDPSLKTARSLMMRGTCQ